MKTVKLEEVTLSITDGKHGDCEAEDGSGYYFISCKDVHDGIIDYSNARQITADSFSEAHKRTRLAPNDILLTNSGTIGRMALVQDTPETQRTTFQKSVAIIKPDTKTVIPSYLYYKLQNCVLDFINQSNGSAQKNLLLGTMRNFKLDIPEDLSEQEYIASLLSAYDELIENNQKQIKLLEEAAQRLYKEWFIDLRFPGHENTPNVDGVPEGWKKASLGQALDKITTGLNPRKNFVLGHGSNYYVTIKNMGDNTFYLDDRCDKVDDEAIEKINKRSDLQIGDLLFSGIGTMGRVALVSIPTTNWNVSESVFTMRANGLISKEYLYLLLLSDDMQSYCDSHSHGVAQKGIRMADLKAFPIILPTKKVMDVFTNLVYPIIRRVQLLRQETTRITEARDRLLPKLMSGDIEV